MRARARASQSRNRLQSAQFPAPYLMKLIVFGFPTGANVKITFFGVCPAFLQRSPYAWRRATTGAASKMPCVIN